MKGQTEKKMKLNGLKNTAAVLAMFCLITAVLITGFQIAIYGDPDYCFYEKEYQKYAVTEELQMEMSDVMEVTGYMMDYLIGREEELSIETTVNGQRQDFFNEQDRLHMADVKNLFLGGLALRRFLLFGCAAFMALFVWLKGDWRRWVPKAYFIGLGIFGGLTVILGGLFVSNFTMYFTIFHEIFFTNDLWMFDPETDLMIRMLPEGFFFDMVVRIGIVFVGLLLVLLAAALVWRRVMKKRLE